MNYFKHFKQISVFILLFFTAPSLFSQTWVNIMLDSNYSLDQKSYAFDNYWANKEVEKGKGFKQFKRLEYFLQNRVNQNGKFDVKSDRVVDYHKIQAEINQNKSLGTAGKWIQLGPFGPAAGSGSGRINTIDFHPTNANIILVGAPAGGIWRSTDGGNSWTTNTDDLASIGISDIKFAPSNGNIVYAATGDRDGGDTYTHGILKSTDGGIHWTVTNWNYPYYNRRQTYRLLVHPTNPDIVFASTNLGFFKTTDGGQTWTRKRVGVYKDIEFKPNDPNTIYIASSSTVAKSTNGGDSFTNLSFSPATSLSRIELAVTAADPEYLYILGGKSSDNGFGGIYLSTDAGSTITTKATSPNLLGWSSTGNDQGGQAWYDLALEVSPYNKNIVFVGGVNIWRSVNAGQSWSISGHWTGSGAPYVHADCHMIKYSPHNSTTVWACTDGGLSKSPANGSQWTEKNNQLSVAQMYRLGASKTLSSKIMTGWQDNGSNLMTSSWNKVLGGDGMECIVSSDNNNILFGSLYYGEIRRSLNNGNNWSSITNSITEEGAWVTPYIQDEANANILYAGFVNVWKTTNKGNSWTKISSFSSNQKINALASAPSNSQIIWAANSSTLYKTTDGGQNWSIINGYSGSQSINYIAINANNPDKVWICFSGFSSGNKVAYTSDGGSTWTDISGNLPNYPVNTIVNDKNSNSDGIYVGTDIGVYYRDNNLGNWVPFMKDLPNVIVKELEIFYPENKIRAATFGRGLWESVLYDLANDIDFGLNYNKKSLNIYPNPAKDVIYINFSNFANDKIQISVYDVFGKYIFKKTVLNKNKFSLNTSQYAKGMYFIEINSNSYHTVNKVIIE
jgi:photosystem II stability/assembly factor-like uncharacterized protein